MSASTETSFHRATSPFVAVLLGALAPRLQLAGRRQNVGAMTVWDGQAGLRLPLARGSFRLGLYITLRRAPDDNDPDAHAPSTAQRAAPGKD